MKGILIVDKPSGFTSHDIVLFVRRRFGIKKVGHAGTLDPMATGVLVLLLGEATRLSNNLLSDDKEYEGRMMLGVRTDTHDMEGNRLSTRDISGLTEDAVRDAFNGFRGMIMQVPPMVSALKHNGERLYKLARKGIEVERKPRPVTIFDIRIRKIELPDVLFFVHCSKGTYIRKLADDVGEKLRCGAHLTGLRRIRSGRFTIDNAVSFDSLKNGDREWLKSRLNML